MQVYELWPWHLGGLQTSLLVPPLLGTFYVSLGVLVWLADNLTADSPATAAARQRASSYPFIALCYGACAASLQLSAALYASHTPYDQIGATLAGVCVASWLLLERTRQGAGLAALCAVAAPASELLLMAAWHTWSYSQPDVLGCFVSWVPACYFFYTMVPVNLSRFLWAQSRGRQPQ